MPTKLIEELALDRAAGQDPSRPGGLARLARHDDPGRRSTAAAAAGRGAGAGRMSTPRPTPLAGVRVIDMAEGRGEMCGRYLADLGADVVRVEPPGGAASRGQAPTARGRQPAVCRQQPGQAERRRRPRHDRRARPAAVAARRRRHLDRYRPARGPGGAGAGAGRRPGAQRAPRRGLDHRLRPHRSVPRLGGDRRDAPGHGRCAQPLRPARPRAAAATGRPGPAGHGDAGRVGRSGGLLERARVRRRRPRRLLVL